jgi:proline iminopeptidase
MAAKPRSLYPAIRPYRTGRLQVSGLHNLYYEECGNPKGRPVVFLHGGPGAGLSPSYRRFFHPREWRVVLFDQRGCGRSTPAGELRENTTWDLVGDIEKLRARLGIGEWVVFGGSWGSTLALAYGETHPDRVKGLILRGIFLARRKEIGWLYQGGAAAVFPDAWESFVKPIPAGERGDLVRAFHKRLAGPMGPARRKAAVAWSVWEASTSRLLQDPGMARRFARPGFAGTIARIECHYFINDAFMKEGRLLRNAYRIRHLPGVIVQGRYDMVCPMMGAWDLHKAWPKAELVVVPDAGHSVREPGICSALIRATDRFAGL